MTTHFVSCMFLASLSLYTGCYNNETITRGGLTPPKKAALIAEGEHLDIKVFTGDDREYKFLKGNYRIQEDTLKGFGVVTVNGEEKPFQGFIPFGNVTQLETEEFSVTKTVIAIAIPVGLMVGLLLIWAEAMSSI